MKAASIILVVARKKKKKQQAQKPAQIPEKKNKLQLDASAEVMMTSLALEGVLNM